MKPIAQLRQPQTTFAVLARVLGQNQYLEQVETWSPGQIFRGWIQPVTREALERAGLIGERVDGLAFTAAPVRLPTAARIRHGGIEHEVLRSLEWPDHTEIYLRRVAE